MITNYDLIKLINAVLNKDIAGAAFNQTDYEAEINSQSIKLFDRKLKEGVSTSKKADKDLSPFFRKVDKTAVSHVVDLSVENPAYILYMLPNPFTARGFDEVTAGELPERLLNAITQPTLSDPIFTRVGSNSYRLYPDNILGATIAYYAYPSKAVVRWTRNATTLRPEYDTVNSVELEWDDINKIEIAYMIIRDAGVNIERRDVEALANDIIKTGK